MKMKAYKADFGVAEVKPIRLKNVSYRADFRGCRSEACTVMPVQLKAVLNQQ